MADIGKNVARVSAATARQTRPGLTSAISPSLKTSQSAGIVPNPGTSLHAVCQIGTPGVSSRWSRGPQLLSGGDDRLGPLDCVLDGVQDGSDGPLLRPADGPDSHGYVHSLFLSGRLRLPPPRCAALGAAALRGTRPGPLRSARVRCWTRWRPRRCL